MAWEPISNIQLVPSEAMNLLRLTNPPTQRKVTGAIFLSIVILLHPANSLAAPGVLNHQGRIAVGGVNFDGAGHFKFALVDAAGTVSLWSNDASSTGGDEPTSALALPVVKGHYSTTLGEGNPITPSVFGENEDVRLRVWFSTDGVAGTFEQLTPDRRIASAGYALSAGSVGSVVTEVEDGSIVIGDSSTMPVEQLVQVGASTLNGGSIDVVRLDDYAFTVGGLLGLFQFDVSDHQNVMEQAPNFDVQRGRILATDGSFIYAIDDHFPFAPALEIYKVDAAGSVIARGSLVLGSNAQISDLVVADGVAWIATPPQIILGSVASVDVSDPDNPVATAGFISGGAISLAVSGDTLVVVTKVGIGSVPTIATFDVTDPANPVILDSDTNGLVDPVEVALAGDLAFVVDSGAGGLRIFDVSNPAAITPRGSLGGIGDPTGIAVEGAVAVVTDVSSGGRIHSIDVSDPDNPNLIGVAQEAAHPEGVVLDAGIAYVADNSSPGVRLRVFEVLPIRATIDGSLHFSGALLDSDTAPGGAGQILSSTGTGVRWIDLLDNDPTNETETWATLAGIPAGFADGDDAVDDADSDPTNELQILFMDGSNLRLTDGSFVSAGAIAAQIPIDAITGSMLADNSVDSAHIVNASITGADILNNTITADDIGTDAVGSDEIAFGAVGSDEIGFEAVGANEIAPGAVGFSEIGAGAVTSSKIGAGAINASHIQSGAVESAEIASNAVTSSKIAANAVNASEIATGAVRADEIQDGAVGAAEIATGAVGAAEILDGSVGVAEIATNGVGSLEIAANAVNSSEIASGAVGSSEIADGSVTSIDIADGTIVGTDIDPSGLQLAGNISIGTSSSSNDDFFYFDDFGTSVHLKWDNSEDRFEFSRGLNLNGTLNAGEAGDSVDLDYNAFLQNTSGSPDSADITNGGDVYVQNDIEVDGTVYADGGLDNGSDRNRKENIEPVAPAEILAEIVAMPVSRWNYIDDDDKRPHIGPMAQDFHAAFRLGEDDKRISTVDAHGVTFAAIQALKAENDLLRKQNAEILKRLEALEKAGPSRTNQ